MKEKMIIKLFVIFALIAMGCNKDDDSCIKQENYFEAEFDDEIIEPRWITGGGVSSYTLYVNRNNEDNNDWEITLTSNNRVSLYFSLVNVDNPGNYSIDEAALNGLPPVPFNFSKTYIYIGKIINDSTVYYFSKEGSGDISITEYNSEKGILVGTFNGNLYNSVNPEITKTITGKFNINLSTLNIVKRPCWL